MPRTVIGCEFCRASLDLDGLPDVRTHRIANAPEAIAAWADEQAPATLVVFEATSGCDGLLMAELAARGIPPRPGQSPAGRRVRPPHRRAGQDRPRRCPRPRRDGQSAGTARDEAGPPGATGGRCAPTASPRRTRRTPVRPARCWCRFGARWWTGPAFRRPGRTGSGAGSPYRRLAAPSGTHRGDGAPGWRRRKGRVAAESMPPGIRPRRDPAGRTRWPRRRGRSPASAATG